MTRQCDMCGKPYEYDENDTTIGARFCHDCLVKFKHLHEESLNPTTNEVIEIAKRQVELGKNQKEKDLARGFGTENTDEWIRFFGVIIKEFEKSKKQELIAKARQKTYTNALHKWGMEAQVFMAVEEMAELTKELCKVRRGKEDKAGLIDEIADVKIMLEQLQFMFGIEKQDIEKRMAAKLALLQIRIGEPE